MRGFYHLLYHQMNVINSVNGSLFFYKKFLNSSHIFTTKKN